MLNFVYTCLCFIPFPWWLCRTILM